MIINITMGAKKGEEVKQSTLRKVREGRREVLELF